MCWPKYINFPKRRVKAIRVNNFMNGNKDKEHVCINEGRNKDEDESGNEFSMDSERTGGDCDEMNDNCETMQTYKDNFRVVSKTTGKRYIKRRYLYGANSFRKRMWYHSYAHQQRAYMKETKGLF